MKGTLAVTGDPAADELLNTDPLALVLGMLLDQQIPMEWAFIGPSILKERLGGTLDAAEIAEMDPEVFLKHVKGPRALHRFPASMGKRMQECCQHIVATYGGDASAIWRDVDSGAELFTRLTALPGYGKEKAKIFTAILAKRFDVRPAGWEQVAAPFSDATPRSVADITSPETLARVREWKKAMKAKGKQKIDD